MSAYRKKPITVDAVQWFKDGDHPGVRHRPAEIVFSADREYFYISHGDSVESTRGPFRHASAWLAVNPTSEKVQQMGEILPFSMWKVRDGERSPIANYPQQLRDYMTLEGWIRAPRDVGVLDKATSGSKVVHSGDWIVTAPNGELLVLAPAVFFEDYEEVQS